MTERAAEIDKIATAIAADLDRFCTLTGDGRFEAAARALRRDRRAGRRPVDDEAHVAELLYLLETGAAPSCWAAALRVAATIDGEATEATARRLWRKARKNRWPK